MVDLFRRKGKEKKRRRRKKSIFETPFIIRLFDRHIKTWNQSSGLIYAKPRKAPFQHLFFRSKRFGLMETKWIVTAIYEAVPAEKMSEQSQNVYRALKGMECILESRGFPRRRFEFKPSQLLTELKPLIPEMIISNDLIRMLNKNHDIVQEIRRLKPDDLEISLHSVPTEYQPFLYNREMVVKAMAEYFKKPAAISWSVSVGKALGQGVSSRKTADRIMYLLNEITFLLGKKVEELSLSQRPAGGEEAKPPEA